MAGGFGRGINVEVRKPVTPNIQAAAQAATNPDMEQAPNIGVSLAPLNQTLQNIRPEDNPDFNTMKVYQDYAELRNFAQSMWKNFGIDVTVPDFSNPVSVAAARLFAIKQAQLSDSINRLKTGYGYEKAVTAAALQDPNVLPQLQKDREARPEDFLNIGLSDTGKIVGRDTTSPTYSPSEEAAVYKQQQQFLDVLDNQINKAEAAGNKQAADMLKERYNSIASLMTRQRQLKGGAGGSRQTTVTTRWWDILSTYGLGADGNQYTPLQRALGMAPASPDMNIFSFVVDSDGQPKFRSATYSPYTDSIYYTLKDGTGGVIRNASTQRGLRQINNIINTTENKIAADELYDFGKDNFLNAYVGDKSDFFVKMKEGGRAKLENLAKSLLNFSAPKAVASKIVQLGGADNAEAGGPGSTLGELFGMDGKLFGDKLKLLAANKDIYTKVDGYVKLDGSNLHVPFHVKTQRGIYNDNIGKTKPATFADANTYLDGWAVSTDKNGRRKLYIIVRQENEEIPPEAGVGSSALRAVRHAIVYDLGSKKTLNSEDYKKWVDFIGFNLGVGGFDPKRVFDVGDFKGGTGVVNMGVGTAVPNFDDLGK